MSRYSPLFPALSRWFTYLVFLAVLTPVAISWPTGPAQAGERQPEGRLALAYLPEDSELIFSDTNIPLVMGYVLLRAATWVGTTDTQDDLLALFGFGTALNVERVTFSTSLPRDLRQVLPPDLAPNNPALKEHLQLLVVQVRTAIQPLARRVLRRAGLEEARHNGQTYYRPRAPEGKAPGKGKVSPLVASGFAAMVADERILLYGREGVIRSIIEHKNRLPAQPRLSFIDPSHHVWVAFVPRKEAAWDQVLATEAYKKLTIGEKITAALRKDVRGLSLGLSLPVPREVEQKLGASVSAEIKEKLHALQEEAIKKKREAFALFELRLDCASPQAARDLLGILETTVREQNKAGESGKEADRPKEAGGVVPEVRTIRQLPGTQVVVVEGVLWVGVPQEKGGSKGRR